MNSESELTCRFGVATTLDVYVNLKFRVLVVTGNGSAGSALYRKLPHKRATPLLRLCMHSEAVSVL